MKLHRTKETPEWAGVAAAKQNYWQKLAIRTDGQVTPGNILTLIGFTIAFEGLVALLYDQYWIGFTMLIVGRLFDIADGYAADYTGTKSPLGESLDAGFDKLITVLTLGALYITHIANWYVLFAVLVPHLTTAVIAGATLAKGKRIHPSRAGKLSMALAWVGLIGLVLIKAADQAASSLLGVVVYALLALSVVLGLTAVVGYFKKRPI